MPGITALADKPLPPPPKEEVETPTTPDKTSSASRRATAPEITSSSPFAPGVSATLPYRPRTRSPYSRGHSRSRSSGSILRAPTMSRAYSSPGPESVARSPVQRPASPLGLYNRHHSPMRKPTEDSFSSFGNNLEIDQTIAENAELEVTPRPNVDFDALSSYSSTPSHNTFPRSRRRPASPLSQFQQSPITPRNPLRQSTSTPSLANSHFNETFPPSYSMSSSATSTPTSMRSRSPSISSLETIPDSPDAEEEAEQIAKLKAAADREDQNMDGNRRRSSLSDSGGRGIREKRKRWSVCGAERRGDLDLETIWEDGG